MPRRGGLHGFCRGQGCTTGPRARATVRADVGPRRPVLDRRFRGPGASGCLVGGFEDRAPERGAADRVNHGYVAAGGASGDQLDARSPLKGGASPGEKSERPSAASRRAYRRLQGSDRRRQFKRGTYAGVAHRCPTAAGASTRPRRSNRAHPIVRRGDHGADPGDPEVAGALVGVRGTWGRMRSSGLLAERCTTAAPSLPAMLTGPSAVEPHSDPPLGSLTNQ